MILEKSAGSVVVVDGVCVGKEVVGVSKAGRAVGMQPPPPVSLDGQNGRE